MQTSSRLSLPLSSSIPANKLYILFGCKPSIVRASRHRRNYASFSADSTVAPAATKATGAAKEPISEANEKVELNNSKVVGTVARVTQDGAYVDFTDDCTGSCKRGFVPLSECSMARLQSPLEVLRPNMQREFMVITGEDESGQILLSLAALESQTLWNRIKFMETEEVPLTVTVLASNRGGLVVQYEQSRGFIPNSQLGPALNRERFADYVGQQLPPLILKVDQDKGSLILSHRRATATIAAQVDIEAWTIGQVVTGVVRNIKVYGAFVDIDGCAGGAGISGLLHISQITQERLYEVEQVLQVGDKLKAMILSIDRDKGHVTLTTKKLEKERGGMMRNKQLVFDGAEAMAAEWRARIKQDEAAYEDDDNA